MQTYNVFYLDGDDTATLSFDAENLDDLFDILRKGEIECILIYDADGKEVFREKVSWNIRPNRTLFSIKDKF